MIKILIIVSLFALSICKNELATKLEAEIEKIASEAPPHIGSLISGLTSSGDIEFNSINVNIFESTLTNKYHLDASIINKFKNIVFSESLVFQTFKIEIAQQASLSEFIGAARNINNMVEFAFVSVQAKGSLIQQYDRVNHRSCSTSFFFFHNCHDNWVNVPRGFSASEISDVAQGLRANAYRYLVLKVTQSDQINGYGLLNPVFRFVKDNDHFYTISPNEHAENVGYRKEGIAFYSLIQQKPGSVPFYRFAGGSGHFYSTNMDEGLHAVFRLESNIGYIYVQNKFGTLPIYRYLMGSGHFYCLYPEGESLNGWRFEGIVGYAYPTNSLPSLNNN